MPIEGDFFFFKDCLQLDIHKCLIPVNCTYSFSTFKIQPKGMMMSYHSSGPTLNAL